MPTTPGMVACNYFNKYKKLPPLFDTFYIIAYVQMTLIYLLSLIKITIFFTYDEQGRKSSKGWG